jgi:hypothetical protein
MFAGSPIFTSIDLDEAQLVLSEAYLPATFTTSVPVPNLDVRLNVLQVGRVTAGDLRVGDAVRIRTTEATNYHLDIPTAGSSTMRSGSADPNSCHDLHRGCIHAGAPGRLGLRPRVRPNLPDVPEGGTPY